ncbi:hypothetical protein SERLA73DRAFT_59119 [Serpula lacrymans var. lacrymans S7.3]|uniref:Uncharacterized protein n=1 Tax=Serpula lacrymans var. lacrymans (strain S7.3) TaxID=936435 RepID=F8Q5P8_SERL3|nr:hypothetical protein SERLA73DRAFT_59119 [Serpula lacrymans var. lacrymans S7.3]
MAGASTSNGSWTTPQASPLTPSNLFFLTQFIHPGNPLTEAELLAVCHAPPDDPSKEHGLTLQTQMQQAQMGIGSGSGSGNGVRNTKRASAISILSGLGVRDPEKALDPPISPTHPSSTSSPSSPLPSRTSPLQPSFSKKPSKLRNFFGQRPPSELITTHLPEYFPFAEKKVLRTARHSMMMRAGGRRDSMLSINPGGAGGCWAVLVGDRRRGLVRVRRRVGGV